MAPERLRTFDLPGHSYNVRRCGYVTPNGTFFDCEPYKHVTLLAWMVQGYYGPLFRSFLDRYDELDVRRGGIDCSIYDIFFMGELEWAKIAAYITPGETVSGKPEEHRYDWKLERFFELTPRQTEIIFPK